MTKTPRLKYKKLGEEMVKKYFSLLIIKIKANIELL
jgi:hypothetical protein